MSEENPKRKQNILQIVPALNCGGVERGTIDIAKAISSSGNFPLILSTGGSLCANLNDFPVKLIKHDVSSKNPIKIFKNINFIEKLIRENEVDLIHARSRAPAWSAYYAAQKTHKPFVTTFHGIYSIKSSLKRCYNSVMVKGDRVIAVSNFVKDHILKNYKVNEDIIRVIHRGVDLEYFTPFTFEDKLKQKFKDKYNINFSCPIIVMPSRMTSWKGQHVLIEALSKIKNLDFFCMLVGDVSNHPEYIKRLKDQIVYHKLQSKVQIFGPEPDVVSLYNFANIIVSASVEPEAFGRTIVEAQAMKKLVIATSVGGTAETIEDNKTGFHVEPGNSDQMADRIKYALSIIGSTEEEKMVNLARKSVNDHFSLQKMQSDTLSVYSELL